MLFASRIFIFVFAPITFVGYWLLRTRRLKLWWLTLASYFLYGWWIWELSGLLLLTTLSGLLLLTTVICYFATVQIGSTDNKAVRRTWLVISLVASLSILAFFKYYMLLAATANDLTGWLGGGGILPSWKIILPIGISFFTFHAMSYSIDVYRRDVEATTDFIEFAAYFAMFPHLIAGPIIRYREVYHTLKNLPLRLSAENLNLGIFYFTLGLVKKILIADRIAYYIDPMFRDYQSLAPVETWLAMIGYSLQIYFDFAGYSLMAIGLGHLLGFEFPQNFNSPYKAVSISDFWRRWHMSLSRWLRDYLYIPIGGRNNRAIALALTMLLGGLWHGADWTFVIWGAYHALLLQLHHQLKGFKWIPRNLVWARIGTFIMATIGWVFFVAGTDKFRGPVDYPPSIQIAVTILTRMFDFAGFFQKVTLQPALVALVVIGLAWAMLGPNAVELVRVRKTTPRRSWAVALGILGAACILLLSETGPFLYFQF